MLAWARRVPEGQRLALLYLAVYGLVILTGITGPRAVTLYVDGEPRRVETYAARVGDIIAGAGLKLREEDRVEPPPGRLLGTGDTISIQRAYPVYLRVGGETHTAYTAGETLAQLAQRLDLGLGLYDQALDSWATRLVPGQVVDILKVDVVEEIFYEEIAPEVLLQADSSLPWGTTRIAEEGEEGVAARVYQVTLVKGREEARELVALNLLREPLPRVILQGTAPRGTRVSRDALRVGDLWQGTASWYGGDGDGFHGRRTASGEIFDSNAMTAAHPFLPFGTRVWVTHLGSGRQVEVRINDRGPFIGGRIIDLSRAAAEVIGMRYSGTATVRVEILALP